MATIKTSQKRARMKNELKSDHGRLRLDGSDHDLF